MLDLVKIDGKWAQVFGAGRFAKFLDTGTTIDVDWNKLVLERKFDTSLANVLKFEGETITDDEKAMIHWGGEEKKLPRLREQVTVFGLYSSQKK